MFNLNTKIMNQKHQAQIKTLKNELYETYLEFLIKHDETPKPEILALIKGCNDLRQLKESIEIIKNK